MRRALSIRFTDEELATLRAERFGTKDKTLAAFVRRELMETLHEKRAARVLADVERRATEAVKRVEAVAAQAIRDAEQREARLVEIIAGGLDGTGPERAEPNRSATGRGKGKYDMLPPRVQRQLEAEDAELQKRDHGKYAHMPQKIRRQFIEMDEEKKAEEAARRSGG